LNLLDYTQINRIRANQNSCCAHQDERPQNELGLARAGRFRSVDLVILEPRGAAAADSASKGASPARLQARKGMKASIAQHEAKIARGAARLLG